MRYVVLRNFSGFPHDPGKDVDVLVGLADLRQTVVGIRTALAQRHYATATRHDWRGATVYAARGPAGDPTVGVPSTLIIHLTTFVSLKLSRLQERMRGASRKLFWEDLHGHTLTLGNGCTFRALTPGDEFVLLFERWMAKGKPDAAARLRAPGRRAGPRRGPGAGTRLGRSQRRRAVAADPAGRGGLILTDTSGVREMSIDRINAI